VGKAVGDSIIYHSLVTITIMEEYFQQFHEGLDRIRTLYHEARKSGQDNRARELVDELHECGFNHYRFICQQIRIVEQMMKKQTDPKVKELLGGFRENLRSHAENLAKSLDKLILGSS
jgi:hypothetical protein